MIKAIAIAITSLLAAGMVQADPGNASSIEQDAEKTIYCSDEATLTIGNGTFMFGIPARMPRCMRLRSAYSPATKPSMLLQGNIAGRICTVV